MAITLWLSADEETLLERIMRAEGYRNKQEAIVRMLRDRAGRLPEEPAGGADRASRH